MSIPQYLFHNFGNAYFDHQKLLILISLEVDQLPDKIKIMYLHGEAVIISGNYGN